jgi:hypothetical protein
MIIHDLHVRRPSFRPPETNSKLIIDPDAVLPGTISSERLQPVPGKGQVAKAPRLVQLV